MFTAVTDNLQQLSGSTHEKDLSHSWQGLCGSACEIVSHGYSETQVSPVWLHGHLGFLPLVEGK